MAIRCDIHLNQGHRKLILSPRPEETLGHLALKLAGVLLFWDQNPVVDPSLKHPALLGQEFRPDLMATDVSGSICLWVECGSVTLHKLNKLARRLPSARLVVLKETPEEARNLRADLKEKLTRGSVEIWSWPMETFESWRRALADVTEIYGDVHGRSFNLVMNNTPFTADWKEF